MPAIRVDGVSHRYGAVTALDAVDLEVEEGTLYALLGPNGAGKTTLLQILAGVRRPTSGQATILGEDVGRMSSSRRARVAYVSEEQPLPMWMRLEKLEAYLAPLYPGWDFRLADQLRGRFRLDPRRRIGAFSRGERMKAAMLCALAPRPRLLLLDEPFTGMDALVKDELVRGLLGVASEEGQTVLVSSHDIGELETLAEWVGFLDEGRLLLSEPMETLRGRFRRVEVVGPTALEASPIEVSPDWLGVEISGPRISFLLGGEPSEFEEARIRAWFPEAARVEVRNATLREVFIGLARRSRDAGAEAAA